MLWETVQVVNSAAVWQPTSISNEHWGVNKDVMFSIHILLAGVLTNQIVPYPSNPYEEYTLSNCVVFTMTLSKALRKTRTEMQSETYRPRVVMNASGKEVLCYGDWGACPYHSSHALIADDQFHQRGLTARTLSSYGDIYLLTQFLPSDVLLLHQQYDGSAFGLSSNFTDLRSACLHGASFGGEKSLVKRLITNLGVDVNNPFPGQEGGAGCVMLAAQQGHAEIVRMLLTAGADWMKSRLATVVTVVASRFGYVDIVKLLLAVTNIDVTAADCCGNTSLILASREGNVELVKLLVSFADDGAGTSMNKQHPHQKKADREEGASLLHCVLNAVDRDGRSSVASAREGGHTEVVEILLAAAAC